MLARNKTTKQTIKEKILSYIQNIKKIFDSYIIKHPIGFGYLCIFLSLIVIFSAIFTANIFIFIFNIILLIFLITTIILILIFGLKNKDEENNKKDKI